MGKVSYRIYTLCVWRGLQAATHTKAPISSNLEKQRILLQHLHFFDLEYESMRHHSPRQQLGGADNTGVRAIRASYFARGQWKLILWYITLAKLLRGVAIRQ